MVSFLKNKLNSYTVPTLDTSRYQSQTLRESIFSASQSYGATDSGPRAGGMGSIGLLWRILGSLCMYAALVMLLRYYGEQ